MSDNEADTTKVFRLANQRLMLTYMCGHIDKEKYIEWLQSIKPNWPIKWIRLAHETCPDTARLHTHVVVDFGRVWNSKRTDLFDWPYVTEAGHPGIIVIKGNGRTAAWINRVKYLSKEDPTNADLANYRGDCVANKIWKAANMAEALENCERPGDATGIIALYTNRPSANDWEERILAEIDVEKDWQKEFIEIFSKRPVKADKRLIHWYFNRSGSVGKTDLVKWLIINEKTKWIFIKGTHTKRNATTAIANAIADGWDAHGALIDIPCGDEIRQRELYTIIECLKDGMITTEKYNNKSMPPFPAPHVVIFSNLPPDTSSRNLKIDRWRIIELVQDDEGIINAEKRDPKLYQRDLGDDEGDEVSVRCI